MEACSGADYQARELDKPGTAVTSIRGDLLIVMIASTFLFSVNKGSRLLPRCITRCGITAKYNPDLRGIYPLLNNACVAVLDDCMLACNIY